MAGRNLRVDDNGLTFITKAIILLVAFVIVAAVYLNYFAYKAPVSTGGPKIVEMRDTVKISYIGLFENGLVFDTSIKSVADDNSSWPKALSFQKRSSYSDFTFVAGKTTCGQGEQDCAIIGMTEAVLGLTEGSMVTHTIIPEKGYGPKDQDKIEVRQIYEKVPVRETMDTSAFFQKYELGAEDGLLVKDPDWGWTARVHVSGGIVTIENSPTIGQSYQLHANKTKGGEWRVVVQSIDDAANNGKGEISIMNQFTFTGGNKLMVTETSGEYFVSDNGDGSYTVDKNREVVGVTLVFQITVLTITKAS